MSVYSYFLIVFSLLEAVALFKAYRMYKNEYLLLAGIRIMLFFSFYAFIGIFNPSTGVRQEYGRTVFVLMQALTGLAALGWLLRHWKWFVARWRKDG